MRRIYLVLLSILLAGCQTASSIKTAKTHVAVAPTADAIEAELEKIMLDDDAAQDEADQWIRDAKAFKDAGATLPSVTLNSRIEQRFASVRKAYDDFLRRHPKNAQAHLAYGSFLNDIGEEDEAVVHWEKAKEADPNEPAAWNNLANHYGHRGPVKKAFEYYEKAIALDPEESVYLQNLATTTYLFRTDAKEFYNINEEQVFERALALYRKAIKVDPKNFPLATDYAQSYYGIKPLRTQQAIDAWKFALGVANDDMERQGVYCHLARVELNSGLFEEARRHLDLVTLDMYKELKNRLVRNLNEKQSRAKTKEPPPATAPSEAQK